MRKIIAGFSIALLAFLFSFPMATNADAPLWDVSGYHEWVVLGTYHHDLWLTQNSSGSFTGTGSYPAGGPEQTSETITGFVSGNTITMTTVYAGPYNPGYTVTIHGTIINGIISGTNPWTWYMTNNANEFDEDEDGVMFSQDKCQNTEQDQLSESLGTNRLVWSGTAWVTKQPKTGNIVNSNWATMDYTYGCTCEQMLESISETTGLSFEGHYKYGCSKSILEDWNRGTYYMGPTWIETVEVPANNPAPTMSVATLDSGKDYFLKAYSTAFACNQPGCVIQFDADYSTSDASTWVDGVAVPYNIYGPNLLDLKVDDTFMNWGAYTTGHEYTIPYAGTGSQASFFVNDLAGSHFNNSGSLLVDIIEDKWVDLW